MLWSAKAKRFGKRVHIDIDMMCSTLSDITTDALNSILVLMVDVVAQMETMMKWWIPIIDALGKIEDATHRMRAGTGFDDNAVKVTLTRIIGALGSYCDAVSLEDHSASDII